MPKMYADSCTMDATVTSRDGNNSEKYNSCAFYLFYWPPSEFNSISAAAHAALHYGSQLKMIFHKK